MYYKVRAKCGHVGRHHYIEKLFFVEASSGKEAARKVRNSPRVKHHHKDAIRCVEKVSCEEYCLGIENNMMDSYFQVTNSSAQRLLGAVNPMEIQHENKHEDFKKTRNVDYIMKRNKIIERQYDKMLSEAIYEQG